MPPELAIQEEFEGTESWDKDGRSELLRKLYFQRLHAGVPEEKADRELARLILEHAKQVVAHPSRPVARRLESFDRKPWGELALDESIEENPLLDSPEAILVEEEVEKPFSCVMALDTSSSMSGEKHLLASVAVAVLLLEVPAHDASLVVFNSTAKTIKRMGSEEAAEQTVLNFLRSRPKGFTNIHSGLKEALVQMRGAKSRRRKVGLLASDGRTTEGGDPVDLAKQFDFLVVLHLHGPGSYLEASREMAQRGNGVCLEVEKFEELPKRLYDALRFLSHR